MNSQPAEVGCVAWGSKSRPSSPASAATPGALQGAGEGHSNDEAPPVTSPVRAVGCRWLGESAQLAFTRNGL